jgi:hypothetical protein
MSRRIPVIRDLASLEPYVRCIYKILPSLIVAVAMAAQLSPAIAESSSISGLYLCVYGCRLTDAAPSVEIEGNAAVCANELGGIYHGRLLSKNSLYCFNKTGTLSADDKTIRWDDGVLWKKTPAPPVR